MFSRIIKKYAKIFGQDARTLAQEIDAGRPGASSKATLVAKDANARVRQALAK